MASPPPISMGPASAGCSIARLRDSACRNCFPRITIRCFRFQRWLANLRILEIKSIPGTTRSHAFIERLIGTIRRECLDQTWFWNQGDLERKLDNYKVSYNRYSSTPDCPASRQLSAAALPRIQSQTFTRTAGDHTAMASFRLPPQLEWYFATHTFAVPVDRFSAKTDQTEVGR